MGRISGAEIASKWFGDGLPQIWWRVRLVHHLPNDSDAGDGAWSLSYSGDAATTLAGVFGYPAEQQEAG